MHTLNLLIWISIVWTGVHMSIQLPTRATGRAEVWVVERLEKTQTRKTSLKIGRCLHLNPSTSIEPVARTPRPSYIH